MIKYSDDVIRGHCASIAGTSNVDQVFNLEMKEPLLSNEQLQEYKRQPLSSNAKNPVGGIYLGDVCASVSEKMLSTRNISYILNVCDRCPAKFSSRRNYLSLLIPSEEHGDGSIAASMLKEKVDQTNEFIHNALKSGSVLVHSARGASRSVFVVAAYLMKVQKWSLDDTIQHLSLMRPSIEPSNDVLNQLSEYYASF